MFDDLNRPLRRPPPRRFQTPALIGGGLSLAVVAVMGFAAWTVARDDGRDAGPRVFSRIEIAPKPLPAPSPPALPPPAVDAALTTGTTQATIETQNGVQVVRGRAVTATGGLRISVPNALALHLPPAPDARVAEPSPYGPLPKIGAAGERPADLYARPVVASSLLDPSAPRLAVVVAGLGADPVATQAAIDTLPPDVTLSFLATADALPAQAERARSTGHELVLQIPMQGESGSPVPRELQAAAPAAKLADDLRWSLGRFAGYTAVMAEGGSRFLVDEGAVRLAFGEVLARGLLVLDAGRVPASRAASVAAGASFRQATLAVDGDPRTLEGAMTRLEATARAQGSALAVVALQPGTAATLARLAQGLDDRGIRLVPVSALMAAGAAPVAAR